LCRRDGRSDAALAIIPAGTANLFASNLEIPKDVRAASRSDSTVTGAGSTSGRSTASGSSSWPAPVWTR
jgi:hypothetical protein